MTKNCKGCGVVRVNYGGIVSQTQQTGGNGGTGTTIQSLALNGTVLTINTSDGSKTVDLAPMLPTVATDLFLKNVQRVANKIVYTVGEKGSTANDTTFEIDVSDLGGTSNPVVSLSGTVLTVGDTNIDLQPILPTQGSDLTTIPEKEFITGSKVIAFDPQGNLYKFGQQSDYYKDVAISLRTVSSDLQPDGSTKHTVEIAVTNARDQVVPKATVRMFSGNGFSDFALVTNGATSVETNGNEVVITGLAAYATVRYTIVVKNSYNDYVSASVIADGDVVSTNNSASLNLTHKTQPVAQQNNYTQECPLITASLDGQNLTQSKQGSSPTGSINLGYTPVFINLVDKTVLAGSSIQIPDAHSVRVFLSSETYDQYSIINGMAFVEEMETNKYKSWTFFNENFSEATSEAYEFANGKLTFLSSDKQAIVYVRPAGAACMWQVYMIGTLFGISTITQQDNRIGVTGISADLYSYETTGSNYGGDNFKNLPVVESVGNIETNKENVRLISSHIGHQDTQDKAEHYMRDVTVRVSSKLTIRLPKGSAYEFTLDRAMVLPEQQGNVTTTSAGAVKVLSTATATDSVYTSLVDIIIV